MLYLSYVGKFSEYNNKKATALKAANKSFRGIVGDEVSGTAQLVHTIAVDVYALGVIYSLCLGGLPSWAQTQTRAQAQAQAQVQTPVVALNPRADALAGVQRVCGPKAKAPAPWERQLIARCLDMNPLNRPSAGEILGVLDVHMKRATY